MKIFTKKNLYLFKPSFILLFLFFSFYSFIFPQYYRPQEKTSPALPPEHIQLLQAMHSISSHDLLGYVNQLCSQTFAGRLTGTPEYNMATEWIAGLFKQWGIQPIPGTDSYFQDFPNPYTLVKESGTLTLHIPVNKGCIDKQYLYQDEFMPGSTSGSGTIKAEVIYVGYGITAPELGFDEYAGVDVKGKIVLMEREIPISPDQDAETFKKWRPYSFHQYKVKNARDHGAAGMLYIYPIANPNCLYIADFILTHVGETIVSDLFAGTGQNHKTIVEKIAKLKKPQSFKTGKTVSIHNVTEHHGEGIGRNVIGFIEGSDPTLKSEAIMLGAHLDHLGMNHLLMPGANDNASGVAVVMGVARAFHECSLKPKRSIIIVFFGAEEQGVVGSEYYLQHPVFPNEKLLGLLNLDGVGRGESITALAGENFPLLWQYIEVANREYIHRQVKASFFANIARPRLDAARFIWAGIPTLSFSTDGEPDLPYDIYHKTFDNPSIITPEIMEDLSQLLFMGTMEMATY